MPIIQRHSWVRSPLVVRRRARVTQVRSPTHRAGRKRFSFEVQKVARVRARPLDLGNEILVITQRCDEVLKLVKCETWCFQVYL